MVVAVSSAGTITWSMRWTVALAVWMSGTTTSAWPPLRAIVSPSGETDRLWPVKVSSDVDARQVLLRQLLARDDVEPEHLGQQAGGVGHRRVERGRVERGEGAVGGGEDREGLGRVERVDQARLVDRGGQRGEHRVVRRRGGHRVVGHARQGALVGAALDGVDEGVGVAHLGRGGGRPRPRRRRPSPNRRSRPRRRPSSCRCLPERCRWWRRRPRRRSRRRRRRGTGPGTGRMRPSRGCVARGCLPWW